MNDSNESDGTQPSAGRKVIVDDRTTTALRAKDRERRNEHGGYPPTSALRRPGPKRKPRRNMRHWSFALQLGKARKSSDSSEVARLELAFARTVVPAEVLAGEPELMGTAFVPNRYSSAYQRTEDFAQIYEHVYRTNRPHFSGRVRLAQPRERLWVWPDQDIIALWRARQLADMIGVPYQFYVRTAFSACMAAGYSRCPAPLDMLRDPIVEQVEAEFKRTGGLRSWAEYCADKVHPMLLAENYKGDPIQVAAHDDLLAKSVQFPHFFTLEAMLIQEKILPAQAARERFGDERVERLLAAHGRTGEEAAPTTVGGQVPLLGCFGWYHADATDCPNCPMRDDCRATQTAVRAAMVKMHGTDDPRGAKARQQATERKRRQRAREKLDRQRGGSKGSPEDGGSDL